MFGTDLPGTRARRSFRNEEIDTLFTAIGERSVDKVLYENDIDFYRLDRLL